MVTEKFLVNEYGHNALSLSWREQEWGYELMVRELADQGSIEKVGVLVLKPTFALYAMIFNVHWQMALYA